MLQKHGFYDIINILLKKGVCSMYESNNLFLVMGTFIFAIVCFSIIFTIVEIIARIKIFEKLGVPI